MRKLLPRLPKRSYIEEDPDNRPIRPQVTLFHGKGIRQPPAKVFHAGKVLGKIIRMGNIHEGGGQHLSLCSTDDFAVFPIDPLKSSCARIDLCYSYADLFKNSAVSVLGIA